MVRSSGGDVAMRLRWFTMLVLAAATALIAPPGLHAEPPKVLDTGPKPNAVLDGPGESFYVRFDRPIDHMNSRLIIKRGADVVETLRPRLKAEPTVLFAEAVPALVA